VKTVFVAIIFLIESSSGQPVDLATAVFESREVCEFKLEELRQRVEQDLRLNIEGQCVEQPVIRAR